MLPSKDINMLTNWYCHPQKYADDFFLFKENDLEKHTTYYEMYFSIIPPFNDYDGCYVSVHDQYDVLEDRIIIYGHDNTKKINTTTKLNVWSVRRRGYAEYQRALYTASKILQQPKSGNSSGTCLA